LHIVDGSGSMSDYSRVTLQFLHAFAETRGHVATFVFGSHLANVTRALTTRAFDQALRV
jgi:uncharacterized protein with von Willebrand factor type A (vWA) domain